MHNSPVGRGVATGCGQFLIALDIEGLIYSVLIQNANAQGDDVSIFCVLTDDIYEVVLLNNVFHNWIL